MTLLYNSGDAGQEPGSRGRYQPGAVRPHPELKVLLDAQGLVMSSHADLALVVLEHAAEPPYRPFPLATTAVQLQESITLVGSGYDETAHAYDGERRFSRNKVTAVLPSGSGNMRIEQPEGHHYRGDSGGPCLREGPEGPMLVGISSRNLGGGETFTSIHEYRAWLQDEIRLAEAPPPSAQP